MDMIPDYRVRIENIKGKGTFYDIGAAVKSANNVITIYLNALPLNNKILLSPVNEGK